MRHFTFTKLTVCLCSCLLIIITSQALIGSDLEYDANPTLPQSIRVDWTKLAQMESAVTGSYKTVRNAKNQNRIKSERVMLIKRMPEYFYMEETSPERGTFILALSPQYLFSIGRKNGANDWRLEKLYSPKDSDHAHELLLMLLGINGPAVLSPLSALSFSDNGLDLVDDKSAQDPTKSIDYSETNHLLTAVTKSGYVQEIQLDPSNFHMIKSVHGYLPPAPYSKLSKVTKSFYPDQKWPGTDLPLLKTYIYSLTNDINKSNLTNIQVDISDYQFTAPPKEIFTLAYYGLPEPEVKTVAATSGIPNYLLFMIAALVAALFAFVIWKYSASKPQNA